MKRIIPIMTAVVILSLFASCGKSDKNGQSVSSDYTYRSGTTVPSAATSETTTEESTTGDETAAAVESTTAQPETTMIAETTVIAVVETVPGAVTPSSAPSQQQAVPSSNAAVDPDAPVDLSIRMPEANGKMLVDKSYTNQFIRSVSSARGIDASLLVAVYSYPDSGQNYVFEFNNSVARAANDIRRVYLLDSSGNITSVAAAASGEKENLSSTENWFCMNVLIKGVIFPAIKDQFR